MRWPYALSPVVVALLSAACTPAPSGVRAELTPDAPTTLDDLVVDITDPAVTIRNDAQISYIYAWYVDGALVSDLTEPSVSAERTRKHQEWEVRVTPTDGTKQGLSTSSSVTLVNSLPEVTVTASDNEPISTDLVETSVETYDADGDPVEVYYTWFKNGVKVPELQGPDLPPDFTRRDDIWRVSVQGSDGEELGFADYTDILVRNGVPEVHDVTLAPTDPVTLDDLVATVDASDPDGDPITLTYVWSVDGVERPSVTGPVFEASRTARGQTIEVAVFASDAESDGEALTSNAVTVLNTPPGPPTLAMAPSAPTAEAALTCVIASAPVDPDDDAFVYTFSWMRDGVDWSGATGTTHHDGDTILPSSTELGDVWTCTAFANDGEADSPSASVSATVVAWTGPRTFTNCGATGRVGPTSAQCTSEYRGTDLESDGVSVVDGIQAWEVPSSGGYRITAYGAQGSNAAGGAGGKGAKVSGVFELTGGQTLYIAVGQQGSNDGCSGGGAGASWVMDADDEPLLIAGGGGGARTGASSVCGGRITEYGGAGSGSSSSSACAAKSTDLAMGGRTTGGGWGSAGAGYDSDGAFDGSADRASSSWFNGLLGGGGAAPGGFGGGGSGNGSCGGGGGGGYSGGDGGYVPGGGGSFNDGASPDDEAGENDGHGMVVIDLE